MNSGTLGDGGVEPTTDAGNDDSGSAVVGDGVARTEPAADARSEGGGSHDGDGGGSTDIGDQSSPTVAALLKLVRVGNKIVAGQISNFFGQCCCNFCCSHTA